MLLIKHKEAFVAYTLRTPPRRNLKSITCSAKLLTTVQWCCSSDRRLLMQKMPKASNWHCQTVHFPAVRFVTAHLFSGKIKSTVKASTYICKSNVSGNFGWAHLKKKFTIVSLRSHFTPNVPVATLFVLMADFSRKKICLLQQFEYHGGDKNLGCKKICKNEIMYGAQWKYSFLKKCAFMLQCMDSCWSASKWDLWSDGAVLGDV